MTMRIVFLKEHDGNKRGQEKFIDRPDAVKLCEKGIAVPFNLYEKIQRKEAKEKTAADLKAKEAKAKEDADKKAELLKKKEADKKETTYSKKPKKAEKAVK